MQVSAPQTLREREWLALPVLPPKTVRNTAAA